MNVLDNLLNRLNESLVIESRLCSRIRHKKSRCTACTDACRSDAVSITRTGGKVIIDWDKCNSCGECVTACRNGVFSMKLMDKNRVFSIVKESISDNGDAVFACGNKFSNLTAGVPTLSFLNRKIYVKAVLMGANRIVLLTGNCDSCEHHFCRTTVQKEINIAVAIFSAADRTVPFVFEPYNAQKKSTARRCIVNNSPKMNRREFFGFVGFRTKQSIGQVVYSLSENDANRKKTVLTKEGKNTNNSYAQDLRLLGGKELLNLMRTEMLMPSVSVDTDKCNLCGVCARMCASGVYTPEYETVKGKTKIVSIAVNQEHCTGCSVCAMSCKAITVSG